MKSFKPSSGNDQILWQQLKSGDKEAFTKIYRDHYPKLLSYGLRIKANEDFVKDCIQETFCDLLNYLDNLGSTNNILFYLIASLRRKIIRKLRYDLSFRIDDNKYLKIHDFPENSMEDDLIDREWSRIQRRHLKSVIDNLPPRQKEALLMRFYLNFDYSYIAEIMEVNIQSVRNLVHQAIKAMRVQMKDKLVERI
jgi:RNA polymerase sigma factor (sigma-70 family)